MSRPKRKQEEIAAVRRRIIDAAVEAFAERGYGVTSMADIAARAGYSAPSLYTYFRSKHAILEGIVEDLHEDIGGMFELDFPEGLTLQQKLDLLLQKQFEWIQGRRAMFQFFMQNGDALSNTVVGKQRFMQTVVERWTRWFEQHATSQDLVAVTALELSDMVWGWRYAAFCRWVTDPSYDVVAKSRVVIKALLAGARSKEAEGNK